MKEFFTPEEIYRNVLGKQIMKQQAIAMLEKLGLKVDYIELNKKIYEISKESLIVSDSAKKYMREGVTQKEAKVLGILEAVLGIPFEQLPSKDFDLDKNAQYYSINADGNTIKLAVGGYEGPKLRFFPEEICLLTHLEVLYLQENALMEIPDYVGNLLFLKELDLSYNEIQILPVSLKNLPHLQYLNLQDISNTFYLDNILDYIDLDDFQDEISMVKIHESMDKKLEKLEDAKRKPWSLDEKERKYPPKKILEKRNFEHIILWMLYNNKVCMWSDFINNPLNFPQSTLAPYLVRLKFKQFTEVKDFNKKRYHRITPFGVRRLKKIENYFK